MATGELGEEVCLEVFGRDLVEPVEETMRRGSNELLV